MIQRSLTAAIAGLVLLAAAAYSFNTASTFSSGSPGNSTGSPGDNSATCRSCHGPGTAVFRAGLITSTIPASGYVPGTTYTITLSISETGRNKYGFELAAENTAKQNKGTFIITNTQQTRAISGGVTHSTGGTSGTGGSKTWTVNWKAPAAGTGNVTFYAAFNAANGNGTDDSGDNIYTSSLPVQEAVGSGLPEMPFQADVQLFPVPSADVLNVTAPIPANTTVSVTVTSMNGSVVKEVQATSDGEKFTIGVRELLPGTYVLSFSAPGGNVVKTFSKI
jgi:hypothetical protein